MARVQLVLMSNTGCPRSSKYNSVVLPMLKCGFSTRSQIEDSSLAVRRERSRFGNFRYSSRCHVSAWSATNYAANKMGTKAKTRTDTRQLTAAVWRNRFLGIGNALSDYLRLRLRTAAPEHRSGDYRPAVFERVSAFAQVQKSQSTLVSAYQDLPPLNCYRQLSEQNPWACVRKQQ